MKKIDEVKITKVYITSPYTEPKKISERLVRGKALEAMQEANLYFDENEKIDLFSPVLHFMYTNEYDDYDYVLSLCKKKLSECDIIFISSMDYSKGIILEYLFALANDIEVVFSSHAVKDRFYEYLNQYENNGG